MSKNAGYFSIQPGQVVRQSETWGLGSLIGERLPPIGLDGDEEDQCGLRAFIRDLEDAL